MDIGEKGKDPSIYLSDIFIKDRVQAGELSINWCPSEDMIGDYFTKPLQGQKFIKFRDLIMNNQ